MKSIKILLFTISIMLTFTSIIILNCNNSQVNPNDNAQSNSSSLNNSSISSSSSSNSSSSNNSSSNSSSSSSLNGSSSSSSNSNSTSSNSSSSTSSSGMIQINEDFSTNPLTRGWTIIRTDSNSWDFSNQDARVLDSTTYCLCNDIIMNGNYDLSVDIKPNASIWYFGVILNYNGPYYTDVSWDAFSGKTVCIMPNNNKLSINNFNTAFSCSEIISCSFSYSPSTTYRLEIIYNSLTKKVTVKVDNILYIDNYTLDLLDGHLGFFAVGCSGIYDNVSIKYNY